MDAFKDAILAHAVYYPVVEVLSSIAIACVIWFGGSGVIRGITTIGVLVAFMQYAQRFFRPIQDLSEKYNILQSAMASSERIFKLLDTPVDIVSPQVTRTPEGAGRIRFEHVWFAYREGDTSTRPVATGPLASPPEPSIGSHGNACPGRARLGFA